MFVMKNICENVVYTIFGHKDTIKVWHDVEVEGIQQHLWLRQHPNNQHKILKPHAPYVLTIDELDILWLKIGSMKLPTNYGASLDIHVANKKLNSMKSYDYHMLMQQVLPLCLWGLMAMELWMPITRLSCVFQWVCVKV